MPGWKPTAREIVAALREHFVPAADLSAGTEEWSLLTEVPSTGASVHDGARYGDPHHTVRMIDVLLCRNWASGPVPYERVAVEVKVSRGDFFRDTDEKRAPWRLLAHRFVYAAPEGMLTPADIPSGCWLIEVSEHPCDGTSTGHKHSPRRVHWHRSVKGERATSVETPPQLLTAIARSASRAENRILRAAEAPAAAVADAEEMRRLRNQNAALRARETANADKVRSLLRLVAPLLPQECADCGGPLRLVRARRYRAAEWQHTDPAADLVCQGRLCGLEPAMVRTALGE